MTKQDYSNQWLKDLKLSRPLIIAGPCSAETEEQILETAKNLKEAVVKEFQRIDKYSLRELLKRRYEKNARTRGRKSNRKRKRKK